jgi:hypothetical protein
MELITVAAFKQESWERADILKSGDLDGWTFLSGKTTTNGGGFNGVSCSFAGRMLLGVKVPCLMNPVAICATPRYHKETRNGTNAFMTNMLYPKSKYNGTSWRSDRKLKTPYVRNGTPPSL